MIQIEEIGWQSLPLVLAAGLALGIVLSMHTRATLVQFGAEAMIPTLQSAYAEDPRFWFHHRHRPAFFGYTTDQWFEGVQRAATSSVVLSSLLIILADVVLVKAIFFLSPRNAL